MIFNLIPKRRIGVYMTITTLITGFCSVAMGQDYSGWWWNEAESGRGVNIGHDGDTFGATVFVYDNSGKPLWATFAGTLDNDSASGPLFTYTGPPMNAPFNPDLVDATQIGSARIVFSDNNNATISYDAGDFTGPTTITRFPLGSLPLDGRFKALLETTEHCEPMEMGDSGEYLVIMTTAQSTLTISLLEELPMESTSCVLEGPYNQAGNRIVANGTLTCTERTAGGAIIDEYTGSWATDDLTVSNEWLHATLATDLNFGAASCSAMLKMSGLRSDLVWANP